MVNLTTRDPRDVEFWNQRFEQGMTPWNKAGVPQALMHYVRQTSGAQNCLIPGCGFANEVTFLIAEGWQVTAIDFSPAAVALAKEKLGALAHHVEQADFFQFTPGAPLSIIYERAFFCALPTALRSAIVKKWAALLAPCAVVAGFFYIDDSEERSTKGPPFSVTSSELNTLMQADFYRLEDDAVLDSLPVFEGKERWQVWRRRG